MNYYIIGSKYGKQSGGFTDILPFMLEKNVIATGFNWNDDMSDFVGLEHQQIINYLKAKSEVKESCYTLKHFLNLKPGDLVAVKVHSAPSRKQARLVIGAYCIVKGENHPIYKYSENLGHTIEVDFIDTDLKFELPFGYGQTIHKIMESNRIESIFRNYYLYESETKEPSNLKNTSDIYVEKTASYISTRAHNKIQNTLIELLEKKYGSSIVKMEKDFVDVLVELEDKFILFEVKSSLSADRCIREALGQILQYGCKIKNHSNKHLEYVIVGSEEVDDSDKSYYQYIINLIKEPIRYLRVSP